MFIPHGKALYENLATSYVLVDALVADLCEGGFSGVVEIVLRDREARVLILRGHVAGIIESQATPSGSLKAKAPTESRPTLAGLATTARRERGRLAIYSYAPDTAAAIAGRANAQPLYTQLSTDFADLEKMLAKLSRERDRQWFIEIKIQNNVTALLHVTGDGGWLLVARGDELLEETRCADMLSDARVRRLLDECNRTGGLFDVYFRGAHDELAGNATESIEAAVEVDATASRDATRERDKDHVSQAMEEARAMYRSLAIDDSAPPDGEQEAGSRKQEAGSRRQEAVRAAERARDDSQSLAGGEQSPQEIETGEGQTKQQMEAGVEQELPPASRLLPPSAFSRLPADINAALAPEGAGLLLVPADLGATGLLRHGSTADVMVEIKRLMAEIARTLEESVKAAEQRDSFSMHIRTGQLQVADRYPFLDPFGAEFEYLAGEIVFVGHTQPEEFIAGLTEALKLAVIAAIQASPQPARLRSIIAEDLRWLRDHQKVDLERYGLDQVIEEITPIN